MTSLFFTRNQTLVFLLTVNSLSANRRRTMPSLTDRQVEVQTLIMRSWIKRGKCPKSEELAVRLNIKVSAVKCHIRTLVAEGYLSDSVHRRVLRDHNGNDVRMECRFVPTYQGVLSISERGAA